MNVQVPHTEDPTSTSKGTPSETPRTNAQTTRTPPQPREGKPTPTPEGLKLKWVACACLFFVVISSRRVVSSHGPVLSRVCLHSVPSVNSKRPVCAFKTPDLLRTRRRPERTHGAFGIYTQSDVKAHTGQDDATRPQHTTSTQTALAPNCRATKSCNCNNVATS